TPMIGSPIMGVTIGFTIMAALTWLVYKWNRNLINKIFGRLQIVSAGFMALMHGHNDAQKSMGIIALALVLAYPGQEFHVPVWVILTCALAMGAGTLCGG